MTSSIWSEDFILGIPVIDEQHKKFFELFEEASAEYENKEPEELNRLLGKLEDYMEYHFQEEEKLMKACGYEEYENHKKQHELFINRIGEMWNDYDYLNPMLFNKIRTFIKKWFVSHILQKDFDYRDDVIGASDRDWRTGRT
jgi:hemerythrin